MSFSPFRPPNYTQTPNEIIDDWLPYLTHVELKVLMVITRKTFGWHKIRDAISLSQLEKLTGSTRTAILKAVKKLLKQGLILKHKSGTNGIEETTYELVIIEDSNSSYQSFQKTGGGLFKRPTKESSQKQGKRAASAAPKSSPKAHAAASPFEKKDWETKIQGTGLKYKDILSFLKEYSQDDIFQGIDHLISQKRPIASPPAWLRKCLAEKWHTEKINTQKESSERKENNYRLAQHTEAILINKLKPGSAIIAQKDKLIIYRGTNTFEISYDVLNFRDILENELRKMGL